MFSDDTIDDRLYFVVMNHEEQYSIWLADRPVPAGWQVVSASPSPKAACLQTINTLWTDLRPLSLRTWLAKSTPGKT